MDEADDIVLVIIIDRESVKVLLKDTFNNFFSIIIDIKTICKASFVQDYDFTALLPFHRMKRRTKT